MDTKISQMPDAGPLLGPEFVPLVQNGINVKARASAVSSSLPPVQRQRSVVVSPIVVDPADQIINCKIPTPATCLLPISASRSGKPVTFNDIGQAALNNIVFTASGGETISGATTYTLRNNFSRVTFTPLNDGQNTGWVVS